MADREVDLLVIGAGIVGLATALEVTRRFPEMRILVVEKEKRVAAHQTGHNSGVIHSGLYYKTGSLKARNCVAGAASMKRFCSQQGIPFEECGKLVVATSAGRSCAAGTTAAARHCQWRTRTAHALRATSSANSSRTATAFARCTSPPPASLITRLSRRSTPS